VNFVDPLTGACTNHVENFWKNMKRKLKTMAGVQGTTADSHLDEAMFRNRLHNNNIFDSLLAEIARWFPLD